MSDLPEVRWKRPGIERSWRYGRIATWRKAISDDFVAIIDRNTGGVYNVNKKYVQAKIRGPRGGRKWIPMQDNSAQ
jgi:hypothetical protein